MKSFASRNLVISLLLLMACCASAHSMPGNSTLKDEENPHRIVGGRPISIAQVPFQVGIIMDGSLVCGGSIINRYWILTAAHCIYGVNANTRIVVRAGSSFFRHGGQQRLVRYSVYHGGYNYKNNNNDIGMLRLHKPLKYGKLVRKVKLPRSTAALPYRYTVSGWGVQREGSYYVAKQLKAVGVKHVKKRSCSRVYQQYLRLTSNQFCAADKHVDSCQGDSGGPLSRKGVQYGIVSFGIGCARAKYPGVYTDLRKYRKWITRVRANQRN